MSNVATRATMQTPHPSSFLAVLGKRGTEGCMSSGAKSKAHGPEAQLGRSAPFCDHRENLQPLGHR